MKRIWRITHRDYIDSAFNGEGAKAEGGRWNSEGTSMVYTSENLSLAVLEILVHLKFPETLSQYVAIPVDLDAKLIDTLSDSSLPEGWNEDPAPVALRFIGDEWCRSKKSLLLAIPSAVVPLEKNYLINPLHPKLSALKIGDPIDLPIDPRLLETLRTI